MQVIKHYEQACDLPSYFGKGPNNLMIASVPRSGSTFFCLSLWSTGLLGAPLEYLNDTLTVKLRARLSDGNFNTTYWNNLKKVRTSPNGIFSFKTFIKNYKRCSMLFPELLPQIYADKLIYFTRRDKVAQAVSYAKARQTVQWFNDAPPQAKAIYDFDLIRRQRLSIDQQENAWEKIFEITGSNPLRITYEDFVERPHDWIDIILSHFEIEKNDNERIEVQKISIQSDKINIDWINRFHNDDANR